MTIGATLAQNLSPTAGTVIVSTNPKGLFDIVTLDTTTRRSHSDEADVTTHPVEGSLSFATDNVRGLPATLTVSGVLTDAPLRPLAGVLAGPGRARDAYHKLLEIQGRGEPLLVATDIRHHADMALVSVAVDEDASTGDAIFVTLGFRKIRILNLVTAPVKLDIQTILAGAGGTPDMGQQAGLDPVEQAKHLGGFYS